MKVIVACEFSGAVRDAFRDLGHDAWSMDLLPGEGRYPHRHMMGDLREFMDNVVRWEPDLMIAHPPCQHLAVSGARWFKDKIEEQKEALEFVQYLMDLPIPRICIENPVSVISSKIRKPDQIIQPWQFGHGETKKTCLWLKNLPNLVPTDVVEGRSNRIHMMPGSKDQAKKRSITYTGIAQAMATQWGVL